MYQHPRNIHNFILGRRKHYDTDDVKEIPNN